MFLPVQRSVVARWGLIATWIGCAEAAPLSAPSAPPAAAVEVERPRVHEPVVVTSTAGVITLEEQDRLVQEMGGADKPRLLHAGVEPLRAFAYQLTPNQQVVRESDLTMRITNGAEIKDRRMKIRFEVRVRKGEDAGNLLAASMIDGSDDSVGSWVRLTQASNGSVRRVVPDSPKPYLCEDVESVLATAVTRSIVQLPPIRSVSARDGSTSRHVIKGQFSCSTS